MSKYKYTKETLDAALDGLQSEDITQRKKSAKFISMASRGELFGNTCDTLNVQSWFLSSEKQEKLIEVLYKETDEKLLWEYLLILQMVCERYIDHSCYVNEFSQKQTCVKFKQRTYEIAKLYSRHPSAIIQQISGSIIGYMGDNDVWEIFCNVMARKKDLLTISHITMGIRWFCDKVKVSDRHLFGGTMTDCQRINLSNSLQSVHQNSSNKSIKGMCLRTIEKLENMKEVANNRLNC